MKNRKTILLVNDDGIKSEGLRTLAEVANKYGDLYIVAPEKQQSAKSHCISLGIPIDVYEVPNYIEGAHAYYINSFPADCVRVGIELIGHKPDLCLSGINNGFNIAADIQYSGTVGAAFEAAFRGIPAIAFSQPFNGLRETTDRYLEEMLVEHMDKPLPPGKIWNINFPDCHISECKGILYDRTLAAVNFYQDKFELTPENDGHRIFTIRTRRSFEAPEGTDLHAICNNYVSVGTVTNLL